mmetsp:Transcript_19255/g.65047  ORF Transcript_19255/g.65047 Transcript_19255/m.65047 type:complete len:362 (+) Transcript_19255:2082-3167(+)
MLWLFEQIVEHVAAGARNRQNHVLAAELQSLALHARVLPRNVVDDLALGDSQGDEAHGVRVDKNGNRLEGEVEPRRHEERCAGRGVGPVALAVAGHGRVQHRRNLAEDHGAQQNELLVQRQLSLLALLRLGGVRPALLRARVVRVLRGAAPPSAEPPQMLPQHDEPHGEGERRVVQSDKRRRRVVHDSEEEVEHCKRPLERHARVPEPRRGEHDRRQLLDETGDEERRLAARQQEDERKRVEEMVRPSGLPIQELGVLDLSGAEVCEAVGDEEVAERAVRWRLLARELGLEAVRKHGEERKQSESRRDGRRDGSQVPGTLCPRRRGECDLERGVRGDERGGEARDGINVFGAEPHGCRCKP